MPYIVGLLWGALGLTIRSLVGRVLIALGISYISYQGIDALLTSIKTAAFNVLNNVPPEFIGIIGLARIGESISVVCSALVAKYALQGMSGTFKKMVIK